LGEESADVPVRAIRGAINVPDNTAKDITTSTERLLRAMCEANELDQAAIISIFFTVTVDLNAEFPAAAARAIGWTDIPLLDAQEIEVAWSMPRVIRVLMHVESETPRAGIRHVYLDKAVALRPDLHHAQ
jgi:chorismate mutase